LRTGKGGPTSSRIPGGVHLLLEVKGRPHGRKKCLAHLKDMGKTRGKEGCGVVDKFLPQWVIMKNSSLAYNEEREASTDEEEGKASSFTHEKEEGKEGQTDH